MMIETAFRTADGPPTSNTDGAKIFRTKPIPKNGEVSSIILSPLPTKAFNLIFVPPMSLL
jgi:hypothetical protein